MSRKVRFFSDSVKMSESAGYSGNNETVWLRFRAAAIIPSHVKSIRALRRLPPSTTTDAQLSAEFQHALLPDRMQISLRLRCRYRRRWGRWAHRPSRPVCGWPRWSGKMQRKYLSCLIFTFHFSFLLFSTFLFSPLHFSSSLLSTFALSMYVIINWY